MKLSKLLCLTIVFLAAATASAQDLKIHVDEKGKVGFADSQGNVVIKCQYESAYPFQNGYAIVSKSDKFGIINTAGEVVLPIKYEKISNWNDLFMIKSGKNYGLASADGQIVLKPEYSFISPSNCYGKAVIAKGGKATQKDQKTYMQDGKHGIIDAKGNILIPAEHKGLWEFSLDCKGKNIYQEGYGPNYVPHYTTDTLVTDCSYLCYGKVGYWTVQGGEHLASGGLLDGNGKILIKEGTYTFVMKPQSNMARTYNIKSSKKGNEIVAGYYDLNNNKYIPAYTFNLASNQTINWTHGDFIGDIAPVNSLDTSIGWSFIDKSGNKLRSGYSALDHSINCGLWKAKNASNTFDVFDENNNDIAALSGYTDIGFPAQKDDKEVFNVKKGEKWAVINRSGNVIVPFEKYDTIWFNNYDFMMVKKNKKAGMISSDGEEIIPTEYENFIFPTERGAKHFWGLKADKLCHHINLEKGTVAETGYKGVLNFNDGYAMVVPKDLKVESTLINRAQMFAPNTDNASIAGYDVSKGKEELKYGYIINTDDVVVMDEPVTTVTYDEVVNVIKEKGGRPLTPHEKKDILLEVTKTNRSYEIKTTIGEEEWNY